MKGIFTTLWRGILSFAIPSLLVYVEGKGTFPGSLRDAFLLFSIPSGGLRPYVGAKERLKEPFSE
jgi:hypothetical protein